MKAQKIKMIRIKFKHYSIRQSLEFRKDMPREVVPSPYVVPLSASKMITGIAPGGLIANAPEISR